MRYLLALAATLLLSACATQAQPRSAVEPVGSVPVGAVTPGGTQLIGRSGAAVAVPDSWIHDETWCPAFEDEKPIRLRAPGAADGEMCGEVPSVWWWSTDSAMGHNLAKNELVDPAASATIGGLEVQVKDSCSPAAACIYPFGAVVVVPSFDIVLLVSGGAERDSALIDDIVSSLREIPDGFIAVPAVAPMSVEDAIAALADVGLSASAPEVDYPHFATGTEPATGSVVAVGDKVRLTIGDG